MPQAQDLKLQEVIAEALDGRLLDVHTAMPGTVLVFDPITSTATVRPGVRRALRGQDEETVYERLPDLPGVPVLLGAGLSPGDKVLILFCEADAQGFEQSGALSDPKDVTRHGLGSPYCVPLGPTLVIGNPLTAQAVALANLVTAQLDALKSAISGWTPVANDGGAALKVALGAWLASPSTVAAGNLKANP